VGDTREQEAAGFPLHDNSSAVDVYVEVTERPRAPGVEKANLDIGVAVDRGGARVAQLGAGRVIHHAREIVEDHLQLEPAVGRVHDALHEQVSALGAPADSLSRTGGARDSVGPEAAPE
jgi:hypothetical protein